MNNGGQYQRVSFELYERQAQIAKAFSSPVRLQMVDLLGVGERSVSELQAELGISGTNVSQHLAVLKAAGVVSTRRAGKQIFCYIAMPEVVEVCQMLRKVLQSQIAANQRLIQ